jgi:hypothetical protein
MELLRAGDEQGVGALAAAEPRAIRFLLGRLWDPDDATRSSAARCLGSAAAAHPGIGVDLARRLMWGLNDESATNGVHGIPALGEIGRAAPDLIAPFVAPLASLSWDDGLRLEIIRALIRIAETSPELVRPVCGQVLEHVCSDDPVEHRAIERLLEVSGGIDGA